MSISPPLTIGSLGLALTSSAAFVLLSEPFIRTSLILCTLPDQKCEYKKRKGELLCESPTATATATTTRVSIATLKALYREEGLLALWRGLPLTLLFYAAGDVVKFGTDLLLIKTNYPQYSSKPYIPAAEVLGFGQPGYWSWLGRWSLVGLGIEVLTTLLSHPFLLFHVRYAIDRRHTRSEGDPTKEMSTPMVEKTPATETREVPHHTATAACQDDPTATITHSAGSALRTSAYSGAYRYKTIRDLIYQSAGYSPSHPPRTVSSVFRMLRRLYKGFRLCFLLNVGVRVSMRAASDCMERILMWPAFYNTASKLSLWFGCIVVTLVWGTVIGTSLYPLDTIMNRWIAKGDVDDDEDGRKEEGGSCWQMCRTIVREEGVLALWRGFEAAYVSSVIWGTLFVSGVFLYFS